MVGHAFGRAFATPTRGHADALHPKGMTTLCVGNESKGESMNEKLMTIGQIATELHWPESKVRTIIGVELEPSLVVGRVKLFERSAVQTFLRGYHQDVLNFLGVLPTEESYDSNIQEAAEAVSEDQE